MSLSRGRALRRALTAAAATLVVGAWLAVVAPVSAAAASGGGGPTVLRLLSQSQWVAPSQPKGPATFTLDLSATGAPAGATVTVTLYSKLPNRSTFETTLHTSPAQVGGERETGRTAPVNLSRLQPGSDGGADLRVTVVPSISTLATAPPSPYLDLACTFVAVLCTGVYPAVVTLESSAGDELDHFTTYLTYAARGTAKLHFAWVVPLAARTSIKKGATNPKNALTPLPARTAGSLEHLITDLRTAGVPVTLEPVAQTVQALAASGTQGKEAVKTLADLSTNQSLDQTVTEGYVPVHLGVLAGAGEPTEIKAQVTAAIAALKGLKVQPGDGTTWIASGQVGTSTGVGLAQVGTEHVVVPDTQLTSATIDYTWASTFQLPFGNGHTLDAAASDRVLASQFTALRGDPALAATRLLADLAMVHFERPSTGKRGLVAVPPAGWHPTGTFDSTLLSGLQDNPVVQPVTLSTFFATVPPLEKEPSRHLASSGAGPALSRSLAHQISTARLRLTAFERAVPNNSPVLVQLGQALLAGEASYRSPRAMGAEVRAFNQLLSHQVSLVKLSADRSITLTARTGFIPITILSDASYTIQGTLTLSSAKFKFLPAGTGCTGKGHPSQAASVTSRSTSCSLALDHATNSVRIDVVARTLGDSPVTVKFTTPGGGLVLAQGRLTVRSTATSVVGVVLTAAALAILLAWWARTWWSGRQRRRAARGGQPA